MTQKYHRSLFLLIFYAHYSPLEIQAQYTDFEHDGLTRQYIYYEPETLKSANATSNCNAWVYG